MLWLNNVSILYVFCGLYCTVDEDAVPADKKLVEAVRESDTDTLKKLKINPLQLYHWEVGV